MGTSYNRIAGQSVERLAALSDGVFAVAMTLLVLDLRVPAREAVHSEGDLLRALVTLSPKLLIYAMSMMTLGIFWIGQQAQLSALSRSQRGVTWMHLWFLSITVLLPFSTSLLAEYIGYRTALLVYWFNILLGGVSLYAAWTCAKRLKLFRDDLSTETARAIERRIIIAQSLYAFGALLCIVNTYWSIGFILSVQLYYAVAPRLGRSGK